MVTPRKRKPRRPRSWAEVDKRLQLGVMSLLANRAKFLRVAHPEGAVAFRLAARALRQAAREKP